MLKFAISRFARWQIWQIGTTRNNWIIVLLYLFSFQRTLVGRFPPSAYVRVLSAPVRVSENTTAKKSVLRESHLFTCGSRQTPSRLYCALRLVLRSLSVAGSFRGGERSVVRDDLHRQSPRSIVVDQNALSIPPLVGTSPLPD